MSLPHNTELERTLLAGIFSPKPEIRHEILTQAKPEFIHDKNLRALFLAAAESGDEPLIAYDKVWERNIQLKDELPREEFAAILEMQPGEEKTYSKVIERLRKLETRRQMIYLGESIVHSKGKVAPNEIAQRVTNLALYNEVSHYNDDPVECTSSILETAINGPAQSATEGFGIESLDLLLRGLRRNDFVVIAAPANVGKTPFALDSLRKRAEAGLGHQLVFTLEMTKEDVTRELVSMHSRVGLDTLLNGMNPEKDDQAELEARILTSMEWVGENFSIIDPTVGNLTETLARAIITRKIAELHTKGEKLDCIMVDYLQLLSGDENEDITAWTRFFKILAIQIETPILLISSLNNAYLRRVENAGPCESYVLPSMADLRGSGNIAFDASKILFLMYKMVDGEPSKGSQRGNRYMYIMKNKYGTPNHVTKLNINRCLSYSDGHKE